MGILIWIDMKLNKDLSRSPMNREAISLSVDSMVHCIHLYQITGKFKKKNVHVKVVIYILFVYFSFLLLAVFFYFNM